MASATSLKAIRPRTDGEGVDFIIINADDGEELRLALPDGSYLDWQTRVGEPLSDGELAHLQSEATYFAAYRKGIALLDFGDMTEAALIRKLRARGFPAPAASRAARRLTEAGLINEPRLARQAVRYYIEKKNYGRARIISELYAKGFTRESVDGALEGVSDETFVASCRAQIARRYGASLPSDPADLRRAIAALYRYGFTRSEINAAQK